jgi:Tfp pilus assembly protein PilF
MKLAIKAKVLFPLAAFGVLTGCNTTLPGVSELPISRPAQEKTSHEEALLPGPQAAELCCTAAESLAKDGFLAEAIAQYNQARDHDPRRTDIARRLAILCEQQGDFERAQSEYRRALDEHPRDASLLNDVGYFNYQRGNLAEAEKWLRQSLQINPSSPTAWVNLGLVLGSQGRFDESYDAFAKAVTPAQARSNVGVLMAKLGRTDEAKQAFQQALDTEPDLKQARSFLSVLEQREP